MPRLLRIPLLVVVLVPLIVALAWMAVGLQMSGRAPFGVFSLLLGVAVGASVVTAARVLRIEKSGYVVGVSLVAAIGLIAMEHVFFYREYVAEWKKHRAENPSLAIFRPDDAPKGFFEFVRTSAIHSMSDNGEPSSPRWVFWAFDFAFVLLGAIGAPVLASRSAKDGVDAGQHESAA